MKEKRGSEGVTEPIREVDGGSMSVSREGRGEREEA
jgi:hypothetical protein